MPVEIKELVIKTTVVNGNSNQQSNPSKEEIRIMKEKILAECKAYINAKLKEEKRR